MSFLNLVRFATVAMFLTVLATNSWAAGEPPRFSGLHGGLLGGYAFADEGWTPPVGTTGNFDLDNGLAGVSGGYNWNMGDFLLGVEADGTTIGASDTITCSLMGGTCTADIDALATVRARAGLLFGEENQFLIYATGGLALVWHGVTTPGPVRNAEKTEATYVVGGGVEGYIMDSDWVSTKLEYLFVGLDNSLSFAFPGNPPSTAVLNFNGLHVIRWGLNFHF